MRNDIENAEVKQHKIKTKYKNQIDLCRILLKRFFITLIYYFSMA